MLERLGVGGDPFRRRRGLDVAEERPPAIPTTVPVVGDPCGDGVAFARARAQAGQLVGIASMETAPLSGSSRSARVRSASSRLATVAMSSWSTP